MPRNWPLDILKFLGFTLLVTAVIALVAPSLPRSPAYVDLSVFLLFTLIIGGMSWIVMPILGGYTERKPFLLRWSILMAALLGTGTVGTMIACALGYYGLGVSQSGSPLRLVLITLPVSLPITIAVGVITTVIVAGRDRLVLSRAELDQQRLDRERAEKLAAEAQLASLSSRVQPHFLFNTLNSIAELIRQNPDQAEQTVERLASLLRSSLEGAETVPLDRELALVRDYLEIQKTRFGDRLAYEIQLAPGLAAAVPPFSVQTLVENAIKHVAAHRPAGVRLVIRAAPVNRHAMLFVTDNGPGFDPGSIPPGHGLDNLQSRLRTLYGDRAGLEFLREPGQMTVRLRIPA